MVDASLDPGMFTLYSRNVSLIIQLLFKETKYALHGLIEWALIIDVDLWKKPEIHTHVYRELKKHDNFNFFSEIANSIGSSKG